MLRRYAQTPFFFSPLVQKTLEKANNSLPNLQSTGRTPSATILKDYDSRSATQWRRLRPPPNEADVAGPLKCEPVDDGAAIAAADDAANDLEPVKEDEELPVHPGSLWIDATQPQKQDS